MPSLHTAHSTAVDEALCLQLFLEQVAEDESDLDAEEQYEEDRYRTEVEILAKHAPLTEDEVTEATLGLAANEILFVSSNAWDALAATWYGYRTLWVNRQNLPFEELGTQPHRTGSQLSDVLAFFD